MKTDQLALIMPILFLTLFGCKENKNKIDDFLLIGYSWNTTIGTQKIVVRAYFDLKSDKLVSILRYKYNEDPNFFTTTASGSIIELINLSLSDKIFRNIYSYSKDQVCIYDGLEYAIYYKTKTGKEVIINYTPDYLPSDLLYLHKKIIALVYSDNLAATKKFELSKIIATIEQQIPSEFKPPPLAPDSIKIKFIGPEN
jgi:hypothetical protein